MKKWTIAAILCLLIGAGCIFIYRIRDRGTSRISRPGITIAKDPQGARAFLDSLELNIVLPEFTVKRHYLDNMTYDVLHESWVIKFNVPLTESVKLELDSLCLMDSSGWKYKKGSVRGTKMDIYTFNGQKSRELIVNTTSNEATLLYTCGLFHEMH